MSNVRSTDDAGDGSAWSVSALQGLAGVPDPKSNLLAQLGETKFADTVAAFKKTADEATGTIAQVRGKVDPAYEKYAVIADRAGETMTHARDLLGEGKGDLKATFANLNAATGTAKAKLPETFEKANALLTKIQTSMDKVQGALDDVKATVANAKDLSAGARSVIVGNRSRLDAIVASIKTTGDNLKAASSEIRRSPWRLLYKPGPGEVANLNLYDSARQFAEGASGLSDAASALRDALKDPNVDQQKVQQLVEQLDKSFTNFNQVETQLWKGVRE